MNINAPEIRGDDLFCVARFRDGTRHMVVAELYTELWGDGRSGERVRKFLDEGAYQDALKAQENGRIKILKHFAVVEGHLIPDRKKRRRRH